MIENVNKIKSIPFDVLKGTGDVMLLLSTYSKHFLKGSQPGSCESCMSTYYYLICTQGEQKAMEYEKIKVRTLTPAWVDIKFIRGAFYDSNTITDELAVDALKNGYLKESDFIKLPDTYKLPVEETEQPQENIVKKGRKPKK